MQINSIENEIRYVKNFDVHNISWQGSLDRIAFTLENIKSKLLNLDKPCYFICNQGKIGVTNEGYIKDINNQQISAIEILTAMPPLLPQQLGDSSFLKSHNIKYAYMTGAMANGIASEELVIALGKARI